jgi:YidC/Oxa1 family membrane protein insertase
LKLNYVIFLLGSFLIIFASNFFITSDDKEVLKKKDSESVAVQFAETEEYTVSDETIFSEPVLDKSNILKFSNNNFSGEISLLGGKLINIKLNNYFKNPESDEKVQLLNRSEYLSKLILKAKNVELPNDLLFDNILINNDNEVLLSAKFGNFEIRRRYLFDPDSFSINHQVVVINKSGQNFIFRLFEESNGEINAESYHNFDYQFNEELEKIDYLPNESERVIEDINWYGFSKKYFLAANIIDYSGEKTLKYQKKTAGILRTVLSYKTINLLPGNQFTMDSKIFLGPKDVQILSSYGPNLEQAHDLGWFKWLAAPLEKVLNLSNKFIKNYGIAIIIITILIRILFLPLTIKSMMSMKKMQAKMALMKPKLDEIKEKFKDDKATQNSEIMKLYSKEGMNPLSSLSGCLPMLIQLPVFVALYNVLLYSLDLRHTSFLWINDLSAPENLFDIVGIPFRILPLVMGISWFLTQKMTPPNPGQDEFQTKIFQYMPILFTVMFWGLPSGLILYWTISNIISIFQQLYINNKFKKMQGA